MRYMKKVHVFCCLAIGFMALASCQKDPNGSSGDTFYLCNDSEMLLRSVLNVDENGTIVGPRGGLQLDEADPGKVTVIAENYAEAVDWFYQIVPDYASVFSNGDQIIWEMRDTVGTSQGQAVLMPSSGKADGRIAEVEVPVSARPLSAIVFIPTDRMGLNDEELNERESCDALDDFYLGATVTVDKGRLPAGTVNRSGFIRGTGAFVVIQEYVYGVHDGILLHLEPGEQNVASPYVDDDKHFSRCSWVGTLEKVHKILKANPSLHSNLDALQMTSWDHWFMCFRYENLNKRYRYHLKDGGNVGNINAFSWYYYEAFVYKFTVVRGRDGDFVVAIDAAEY